MASDGKAAAAAPVGAPQKLIVEGQATIPYSEGNEVFYNKVQIFNRDLSIHVIKLFVEKRLRENAEKALRKRKKTEGAEVTESEIAELDKVDWAAKAEETAGTEGVHILDALAATALRSVRYLKEIPGVKQVTVNDLDEAAVEAARRNMEYNKIPPGKVSVQQGDATIVMYSHRMPQTERFDVVDLDPYGSAAPFLDAAVQAVSEGGLICVTCTDMAVLSGSHVEKCYVQYGSVPTKARYLHEMALRIVLHALQTSAGRYKRYIVPMLSCSIDFYVRLFVRVYTSPSELKKACLRTAYVHQSAACPSFFLQDVVRHNGKNYTPGMMSAPAQCPQTGARMKVGGPMWSAPIHDMRWVRDLLKRIECASGPLVPSTKKRIHGVLTAVSEELQDVPLYYTLPDLCGILHCNTPRMAEMQAAILNAGYRVSQSHRDPTAVKTDAPGEVVWDILRCWVKKHPISSKRKNKEGEGGGASLSPGATILAKEPEHQADFTVPASLRAQKAQAKAQAVRWAQNPEAYWGPKHRAKGGGGSSAGNASRAVPGSGAEGKPGPASGGNGGGGGGGESEVASKAAGGGASDGGVQEASGEPDAKKRRGEAPDGGPA